MKSFSWVYHVLSETRDWEKACGTLSRRQLELYQTLPQDLLRVVPVLTVSALPMAQNVVFPLALMYPKQLLSSHFWTTEVREQFELEQQRRRHHFYRWAQEAVLILTCTGIHIKTLLQQRTVFFRKLLRDLTRSSQAVRSSSTYPVFKSSLDKLDSSEESVHPSTEEILQLQELFCEKKGVFHLSRISSLHVRHLMRVNGLRDLFWWRYKLAQHANLLRQIDLALMREGGVAGLAEEADLRASCHRRGLNCKEATLDEMEEYLGNWLEVSTNVDRRYHSMLLHLPVFLGCNHRTRILDEQPS